MYKLFRKLSMMLRICSPEDEQWRVEVLHLAKSLRDEAAFKKENIRRETIKEGKVIRKYKNR